MTAEQHMRKAMRKESIDAFFADHTSKVDMEFGRPSEYSDRYVSPRSMSGLEGSLDAFISRENPIHNRNSNRSSDSSGQSNQYMSTIKIRRYSQNSDIDSVVTSNSRPRNGSLIGLANVYDSLDEGML